MGENHKKLYVTRIRKASHFPGFSRTREDVLMISLYLSVWQASLYSEPVRIINYLYLKGWVKYFYPCCETNKNYILVLILFNGLGIRLRKEDFIYDLKLQRDSDESVARIRLVKTENPSACVTVNWKLCRIAIALYYL
jgi:hypothetical protein